MEQHFFPCPLFRYFSAALMLILVGCFSSHNIRPAPMRSSPHGSLSAMSAQVGQVNILTERKSDPSVTNLLLIGHDGTGDATPGRSDCILLCSFPEEAGCLMLTSFLRDLYVPIPGHGSNRLNAAYAIGGAELLRQTIESNFDITVDGCIELDFVQFTEVVDLLGGAVLELRRDEAAYINHNVPGALTEGSCRLNGQQALTYVRIRKLDPEGDFGRTARQRKLLEAMVHACQNLTLRRLLSLLKEAVPMLNTDVPKEDLLRLAFRIAPTLRKMQTQGQCIPAEGTYRYETIRGMSVLVADLDAAREQLRQTLSPGSG